MFSRFPFLLFLIFFFSFLFFFFLEDQLLLVWNPLFSQSWILLCDSLCEPPDPPPFLCFCLLPFKCKQWSPIFYFSLWSDLLVTCCNICSADYFSFPSFLVRTHFKMTSDLSIRDLSRRADCQANVSILCRSLNSIFAELQGDNLWVQPYFPFPFIKTPAEVGRTSFFLLTFLLVPFVVYFSIFLEFTWNFSTFLPEPLCLCLPLISLCCHAVDTPFQICEDVENVWCL